MDFLENVALRPGHGLLLDGGYVEREHHLDVRQGNDRHRTGPKFLDHHEVIVQLDFELLVPGLVLSDETRDLLA